MKPSNDSMNPWFDIKSYTTSDSPFFKGREDDVRKFYNIVNNGCMSAIYANSGIGKTSFINAGIIPLLLEEDYYPIHISFTDDIFGGVDIVNKIYHLIRDDACKDESKAEEMREWRFLYTEAEEDAKRNGIADAFASGDGNLWWLLHAYQFTEIKTGRKLRPLIIFDQFEDVFTKTNGEKEILSSVFGLIDSISPNYYPKEINDYLQSLAQKDIYVNVRTGNDYKVIFSLRKEFLSDFDYWTNDRHSISDLLTNRMLLMPMTREQAIEVITKQPKIGDDGDIVEGETTKDLEPFKEAILQRFDGDYYEPFLLSVLCSRLYQAKMTSPENIPNTDQLIENFYREAIKSVFHSEKQIQNFEDALVDLKGIRSKKLLDIFISQVFKLKKPESVNEIVKELESKFHLIRVITIGENKYVELSHDRVAEVIHKRQRKRNEDNKAIIVGCVVTLIVISMSVIALYYGLFTNDKNKVLTPLTEVCDHRFSTSDTLWIAPDILEFNGVVEEFSIETKKNYKIANCPYLNVVDLSRLGTDSLTLKLSNLPALQTIVMPDSMPYFNLSVEGCPRLVLSVNRGMGRLELNARNLKINIARDVKRYVWKSKILWDLEEKQIVYYDASTYTQNNERCFFPAQIKERSIKNKDVTFQNLQPEEKVDDRSWSSHYINESIIDSKRINPDTRYLYFTNDMVDCLPTRICYQFHRLDSVQMPRNLRIISESAFEGCNRLTDIHLPEGLRVIDRNAFKNCKSLSSIVIPASVERIMDEAFAGCDMLSSVTIEGGNTYVGTRAFAFCPVLCKVDWKPKQKPVYSFFDNPFFDSPELEMQNQNVEIAEQPKLIGRDKGTTFHQYGFVYAKKYSAELHFPLNATHTEWDFIGDVSDLTDIYVPFAHPDLASVPYNIRSSFSLNLTDEQKANITLHVPYGCKRYYEFLSRFETFLQIEEISAPQTLWMFSKARFNSLMRDFTGSWFVHVSIFLVFFLVGFGLMRLKRQNESWFSLLPYALLYAVFVVVATISFFWANMFLEGFTPVKSAIIGVILALIFVTYAFMFRELRKWIKNHQAPSPIELSGKLVENVSHGLVSVLKRFGAILKHYWKRMLFLAALGALALVSIGYYRYIHSYEQAIMDGNYERALSLLADQLTDADGLTGSEQDELRRMLIRARVEPEFRMIEVIADYRHNYSSQKNTYFYFKQNGQMFSWYHDEYYKWDDPQKRFGSNAHYRMFVREKMISFYDEEKDVSDLYSLTDNNARPLSFAGEIEYMYVEQNILFAKTKDGQCYVYDMEGHKMSIPSVDYSGHFVHANAVVRKNTVYTHCGDSLVYHDFGKGEMIGLVGRRFILWSEHSGEQHYYDMLQNFILRDDLDIWVKSYSYTGDYFLRNINNNTYEVMSADLKQRATLSAENHCYEGKSAVVYKDKTGLHVFDTRQFKDYLISNDAPDLKRLSGYSMGILHNRYLIISDLVYLQTYIIDLDQNCHLMGHFEGCQSYDFDISPRLQSDETNYLWLDTGTDSIQFYRFDGDRIKRGARLPMSVANEEEWTNGFIIAKKDGMTLLYSMDDEVSKPIELHTELTGECYLNGRTMLIPVGDKLHVYRYDGTKELINRSALSQKQKQQLLLRIKE